MLLLISIAAFSFAQDRKISGTLIDKDTKEPLPQVTLQLLKTDSSFVGGTVSADDGRFSLAAPKNGKYLLILFKMKDTDAVAISGVSWPSAAATPPRH